jgi:hypothetical protein
MPKNCCVSGCFKLVLICFFCWLPALLFAQHKAENEFWKKVQFGGGIGLSVGSGFTNIALAPSAIYNFNEMFAAGVGLQGSYVKVDDRDLQYKSYIYGGSLIGLVNPVEQVQLSAELEQLRINQEFTNVDLKNNFWNTALFLGAGYYTGNVTVGIRYNVLFNRDDLVYNEALMPFIRVFF